MDGIKFFLSDGCQLFVHCFFLVMGACACLFVFSTSNSSSENSSSDRLSSAVPVRICLIATLQIR